MVILYHRARLISLVSFSWQEISKVKVRVYWTFWFPLFKDFNYLMNFWKISTELWREYIIRIRNTRVKKWHGQSCFHMLWKHSVFWSQNGVLMKFSLSKFSKKIDKKKQATVSELHFRRSKRNHAVFFITKWLVLR